MENFEQKTYGASLLKAKRPAPFLIQKSPLGTKNKAKIVNKTFVYLEQTIVYQHAHDQQG